MVQSSRTSEPQLWPVFICYRQVDGLAAARRLHELLDKREATGPKGEAIRFDVYLDQTMPAVADWREIHRPYLEKARAFIVVCSPGAKIDEGPDDWVHKEISWWLEHRTPEHRMPEHRETEAREPVPILIDPLRQGIRYVPTAISQRWPEIQRIPLVESEWSNLPAADLEEKASALRRQIVCNILPSGAAIYAAELEAERQRAEGLDKALKGRTRALRWVGYALGAAVVLLILVGTIAKYAADKRKEADTNRLAAEESTKAENISRRVSQASLYDAQASAYFDEARREEARFEAMRQLKREKRHEMNEIAKKSQISSEQLSGRRALAPKTPATPPDQTPSYRMQNLVYEIKQLDNEMKIFANRAKIPRQKGYQQLDLANAAWQVLQNEGHRDAVASRKSPRPPYIFSVELINAGAGESIIIHYGKPDATHLVMINAGPTRGYKEAVRARLKDLKEARYQGSPTPIELFVASDQDEHKTGAFHRLLDERSEGAASQDQVVEFRRVWANMFSAYGLRGAIRGLVEQFRIPLNTPFDHLVARPDKGMFVFKDLPDGMEVVVLGPTLQDLKNLFDKAREEDTYRTQSNPVATVLEEFPDEHFSRLQISHDKKPLPSRTVTHDTDGVEKCVPSQNAASRADVSATDESIPNLASTVLLFRYQGMTFLHTGDSRADLILRALASANLLQGNGTGHVNLLHIPHLGSNRNLTPEFLRGVTADQYLFTGDGEHGNPEISTIAALVAARQCEKYTMHFVNRDSAKVSKRRIRGINAGEEAHGKKLDRFFAAENPYNPQYLRVFRSPDDGSVIIDLLDRVTY